MNPRRFFLGLLTSAVMSATIALPALAAAPTFSGTLTCIDAVNGDVRELNTLTNATRHVIATERKRWAETGFCANGSFDTSGLTQDP